jgi:hypothetical protein
VTDAARDLGVAVGQVGVEARRAHHVGT